MLLLPTPQLCLQIKQKINKFLWDGKPPRIKYTKVILAKADGGLALTDIHLRNLALKASWVPRIIKNDESVFAKLMYYHLPVAYSWIWECNITSKSIEKLFPLTLWIQIWSAWAEFNYEPPYCRDSVLLQVLWYNEHILRNNTPWFSAQMVEYGIIRFQDIFDENSDTILTYPQICTRYNTNNINIMQYNSLVASIPHEWKTLLNMYIPLEPSLLTLIYKKPKMSSYLYSKKRNCLQIPDGCRLAWQNDLNDTIDTDSWNTYIAQVHKISNQVDLTYLQYRIVHRILTTNRLRNKWDSQISPLCQFCKNSTETLLHLLIECQHVHPLWKATQKILQKLLRDNDLILTSKLILFNCAVGSQKKLINSVLLCVKQYIYSAKCQDSIPRASQISSKILQMQKVERLVAIRQHNIKKHERKWDVFLTWMFPNV